MRLVVWRRRISPSFSEVQFQDARLRWSLRKNVFPPQLKQPRPAMGWAERQTTVRPESAFVWGVPTAMGTAYGYTPSHVIVKRQNYTLSCHGIPRSCLNLREGALHRLSGATARSGVPPQAATHQQHHHKQQQQQQGNSWHSSRWLLHNCLLISSPQYYCFPLSAVFYLTIHRPSTMHRLNSLYFKRMSYWSINLLQETSDIKFWMIWLKSQVNSG